MKIKNKAAGFTLIELMIAVAIVGILTAIAYPMYLDKVRAARRVDAKSALLEAANREEQYYTTQHHYTDQLDDLGVNAITDNKAYSISASLPDANKQKFTITAKARDEQRKDQCVTYSIDEIGRESATDSGDNDVSDRCW